MIGAGSMYRARVAALGMAHATALAKLLRAHGRNNHAAHLEAAVNEVVEIVSQEVGRGTLTQAMNWVTDKMWDCDSAQPANTPRH